MLVHCSRELHLVPKGINISLDISQSLLQYISLMLEWSHSFQLWKITVGHSFHSMMLYEAPLWSQFFCVFGTSGNKEIQNVTVFCPLKNVNIIEINVHAIYKYRASTMQHVHLWSLHCRVNKIWWWWSTEYCILCLLMHGTDTWRCITAQLRPHNRQMCVQMVYLVGFVLCTDICYCCYHYCNIKPWLLLEEHGGLVEGLHCGGVSTEFIFQICFRASA